MRIFIILSILTLFASCSQEQPKKQKDDFTVLMGSNKNIWKFVETNEDMNNIKYFQSLYDQNKDLQYLPQKELKIPKTIHLIWLGPNPFPKESIENVRTWVHHHPDWKFKFWTDRKRALPHPKFELILVSSFNFLELKDQFNESDNYAEKADILRYEVLYQEGGLYVDHDVKCYKPFSPFHSHFDLYCGIEPPHQPVLSSSISACNNVIGARSNHPVLKSCMSLVKERWHEVGEAYPGLDKESIIYRIANRTFSPFDESIKLVGNRDGNKDIAFPAAYFNQIENDFALYAHHYYASTWFEDETKFEKNVRRRLISITRKNNQILLINAVILSANLVLFGSLFVHFRKLKRKTIKK